MSSWRWRVLCLWGYDLPELVDWVPLLVMSLVVGAFEAVFFRGFVQGRLEASSGTATGVGGAATLYALYHVGYGMGADEMGFLFGLGVLYTITYRLVGNVLVLWPLLSPLGAFFNNLEAGDIELPWASIAGFAHVASPWSWSSRWPTATNANAPPPGTSDRRWSLPTGPERRHFA